MNLINIKALNIKCQKYINFIYLFHVIVYILNNLKNSNN